MTAPMTCEPPPESRDVRWHWVQRGAEKPEIAEWKVRDDRELWKCVRGTDAGNPKWMTAPGYRYIAPIPMPEIPPRTHGR